MQGVSSTRLNASGVRGRGEEQSRRASPADFPIRLGPQSLHGGVSFPTQGEKLGWGSVQRRQTLGSVNGHTRTGFGESLSSSGQLSIDCSVGDGKYGGPVRMKPPAESGVGRKASGGSESVASLTRHRSLSSSGTIRTAGSSVERRISSGTKNWVAKESRRTSHVSPFSSPREAELKRKLGGVQDSAESPKAVWVNYMRTPGANQPTPHDDVPSKRKGLIARADHHGDPQIPTRSLVVSPRNQPHVLEEIARGRAAHEDTSRSHSKHRNGHDLTSVVPEASRSAHVESPQDLSAAAKPGKDGSTMPGWTGLTKDTMELLLKLREDEEVRLLRQRAVTRWLNHLPIPEKYVEDMKASSRTESDISSLALNESSELDSILDSAQPTRSSPVEDSLAPHVDKKCNRPPGSGEDINEVVTPIGLVHNSFSRSDSLSVSGADVSVDKPEFEFVDNVDPALEVHGSRSRGFPSKKKTEGRTSAVLGHSTQFAAIPSLTEGHKNIEKLSRFAYGSFEKYSGDLDAIPEIDGGSAINDEDDADNGKTLCLVNAAMVGSDSFTDSDISEAPQRPPPAAERWTSAFSSIEHWVESRSALKLLEEDVSHLGKHEAGPEPDLEIAVDVQERLNSLARSRSLGRMLDESLTPKSAGKHTYGPVVKDTKDGGLGWYLSDDCDSSRIAAGSQPTDASKSPRTRQHTQLLSPRSSMYSDEGGLRFHVKYSIPEDEAVTGSKSMEEDESDLGTNLTDLQSLPATPAAVASTPTKRKGKESMLFEEAETSSKGGSMDSPRSGSVVQELEARNACWTGPSEDDCTEECKDIQDVGSRNPQGTYWLPDFCQNNALEPLDLSNTRDLRTQPSTWHVNPLSLSGGERTQRVIPTPSGAGGFSSSKIPTVYPTKRVDGPSHARKRVQFHTNVDQRVRSRTRPAAAKKSRTPSKKGHRNKSCDQPKISCTRLFGLIAALCTNKK